MLVGYLKQKSLILIGLGAGFVIFAAAFALYHLPIQAVLYPSAICIILFFCLFAYDYIKTLQKHRRLEEMQKLSAALIQHFPAPDRIEDEDYQRIIKILCDQQNQSSILSEQKYNDMIDYYTIWAHQVKTPIASMRLKLQNDDSALSRSIAIDLSRIEQYVEMVLTFLRLDSDSTDFLFRSCSLDSIIRQSVRKLSSEFIAKKIALKYDTIDLQFITDEKWLCFVIEQILSNALKYTPSGSISISMSEPNILRISDTGIGIAPEDLPRIFEKGYTGFNGRDDKRASGLGLYLCRRICGKLGIKLSAESELDAGTTILLDLSQNKFIYE